MTNTIALSASHVPFHHADEQEYRDFVQGYANSAKYGATLLRYRRYFVQRYPDIHAWFAAPLAERIGRLYGEDEDHIFCPVSYQARSYLMYLALRGYAPLDWEWLIAAYQLKLERMLCSSPFASQVETLEEEAVRLGYKRAHAHVALRWTLNRLFLHLGTVQIEALNETHIDQFIEALERFRERPDVALFFGSTEQYTKQLYHDYLPCFQVPRTVLYHRGQAHTRPRGNTPRRSFSRPVLKPRMEAIVTRYLAIRQVPAHPDTIKNYKTTLYHFIAWIVQVHPELDTFADVTREHLIEYAEALNTMQGKRTLRPFAAATKQKRLSHLSVFFSTVAFWGWDDVPRQPLLQYGDLPKLPQRVPRYIPESELERLMAAIRSLECPYQRAALLVARWSGARREEIQRLSINCLDSYPDGTPRLHIPAGKMMQERLIPLNPEAAEAIRILQALRKGERGLRDRQTGVETRYLFMHRGKLFSVSYLFEDALEKACFMAGLVTSSGKPTVSAHRFRHTVGTQLARRGARLRTIQKILGHESAGMSMVYIGITDEDVRQDYQAVLGPGAIIAGPGAELVRSGELAADEVQWLKSNYFKTELELGRCLRLPQEGPCECDLYLTCAKFVTSPEYAPRLRRRRKREMELVEDAISHSWQREVERHQCTIRRLEQLLMDLGEPIDGPEATD